MSDFADDNEISMNANFGDDADDLRPNGESGHPDNQGQLDGDGGYDDDDDGGDGGRGQDEQEANGQSMGHKKNANKPDDEERKLFLGGLSWDTEEQDLRSYFSKFGEVNDVSIKYDAVTRNPRGFGFITFAIESSIDSVLKGGPHIIRNKTIDPKRAKSRPICKKIFVGGVDPNMSEDDLKKYFARFGAVEGIELPFDRQRNRRREFCFVIFDTEEAAEAAVKEPKQFIGNKECDIKKAQPQPVAQQQKRMQQQQAHGYWDGNYDGQGSGGRKGSGGGGGGGRSRSNQDQNQNQDQWGGGGYNGTQNYYQGYYGTQQYNAYGNTYPGYYDYSQYYGYGPEYWNYYGYGDGSTDYSQSGQIAESPAGYGSSGQGSSQGSSHSQHHAGSDRAAGGKMQGRKSTSSAYHPYRTSSGH